MNKKLIYVALSIAVSISAVFIYLSAKQPKSIDNGTVSSIISDASSESSSSQEINGSSYFPNSSEDGYYGIYTDRYKRIIESGRYKLTVTRQKQIGGFSVPITTITYVTETHKNVLVYEGHAICSEVFIDQNGVYFINSADNEALLMPLDSYETNSIDFSDLIYQGSGVSTVATSAYEYESFLNSEGAAVELLYSNGELRKMKIYSSESDYELLGIEITTDISGCRSSLDNGIVITDIR